MTPVVYGTAKRAPSAWGNNEGGRIYLYVCMYVTADVEVLTEELIGRHASLFAQNRVSIEDRVKGSGPPGCNGVSSLEPRRRIWFVRASSADTASRTDFWSNIHTCPRQLCPVPCLCNCRFRFCDHSVRKAVPKLTLFEWPYQTIGGIVKNRWQ